jgi:hypothetical protein
MKLSEVYAPESTELVTCTGTPQTSALSVIESEVVALSPAMTGEQMLEIYDRIKFYKSELTRIQSLAEERLIEWIKANGDLQVREGVRYYVGREKRTKCTNLPAAVEALLASAEGDFARFCEGLSSGAVKYGHAAKVLPAEVYEQCFQTEYVEDLKEGGAKKKLLKADEQFIKPAARPVD